MDKIFLFSLLLIVPIIIISCGRTDENNADQVSSGAPVTITHPFKTNLSDYIELNGNTVFLTKEIIRSTFQGYVEKVYKNVGDDIKSGDDLFQIRTIESAAAESLNISFGGKEFRGTVNLKTQSNGVLTELNYHQGDFVSNGEQLAIISNPSSMRIDVNVPFEDVSKVIIGNSCEIQLPGGENLKGIIDRKIPKVDSASQTQTYLIKLADYKQLPENLNITVKIPFRQIKDAFVIPKNSVAANVTQDSFWVMKLINDTSAVRVNVQKGVENDSLVQLVNTSLKPDDRIILTGAYGLPDTVKVDIQK
ncbi:MAG TPA: efflux RND transporter periplasmic adaptor subunit [Ignavibacteriaceae bacterium]|nr:efflux RND transporter periplasmic adaptor subunit [Ignavibacteriaceae bacterium]